MDAEKARKLLTWQEEGSTGPLSGLPWPSGALPLKVAARAALLIVDDAAKTVEFEVAALEKEGLELFPRSLDPRLGSLAL